MLSSVSRPNFSSGDAPSLVAYERAAQVLDRLVVPSLQQSCLAVLQATLAVRPVRPDWPATLSPEQRYLLARAISSVQSVYVDPLLVRA